MDLPEHVRALFWDHDEGVVTWEASPDLVISRVLSAGGWEGIQWLRRHAGDAAIRAYLERTRGRALSPRQLRLWETVLGLSHQEVTSWIEDTARRVWERRLG